MPSLLFLLRGFAPSRESLFKAGGRVHQPLMPISMSRAFLLVSLLFLAGCTSANNTAGKVPANAIASRLDSLVTISHGDYIHLHIGPCKGHCEASVSIFQESPAKFHIYEGEAWRYNEFDRAPILYRLRRPITSDIAENIFRRLPDLGLFGFVEDRTIAVTDHPTIWLRARIGGRSIALDDVNLGGTRYAGAGKEEGLYKAYASIRTLLLAELYGSGTEGADGR